METNTKFLRDIKDALDDGGEAVARTMPDNTGNKSNDFDLDAAEAGLSIESFDHDDIAIEHTDTDVTDIEMADANDDVNDFQLVIEDEATPDTIDKTLADESNLTFESTTANNLLETSEESHQEAISEIEIVPNGQDDTPLSALSVEAEDGIVIADDETSDIERNELDLAADEFDGDFKTPDIQMENNDDSVSDELGALEAESDADLLTQFESEEALASDEIALENGALAAMSDGDEPEGHDYANAASEADNSEEDEPEEKGVQTKISKIGKLLLELGKITPSDTKRILRTQKKHGLLFGDAALKLGLINNDDIQKVVAMQFNYHYLQAGQGKFSEDLVAAYAPFSKKVEAYRALRSQLMMRWFKKGNRMLTVVSANSGEGVSYLTANMGVVFSQLGARTLIIEANMRAPRLGEIFNMQDNVGLSDVIVGRSGVEGIREIESIPDLSVLSAGTVPPNPQELLGRTSFSLLLKTLEDNYDVILIDTPPVIESADAQSAIEIAGGALLVSRLNHTRHSDIIDMRNQIEMTGAKVVGALMNEY